MPYDPANNQFFWGYTPAPDGSNYQPNKPSPKLSDAFRVIKNHAGPGDIIQMVAVGKIKYRVNEPFDGVSATIDFASLEATATGIGLSGKSVQHGGGGFSIAQKIQSLMGLKNTPEKVTGIYFRILN